LLVVFLVLNVAVKNKVIDSRSKAYGLDYVHPKKRPPYQFKYLQQLFTPERSKRDKRNNLKILENWKSKFPGTASPPIVFLNVSAGGSRSAVWCMDVLQTADSLLGGRLLNHTVLITGASGGM